MLLRSINRVNGAFILISFLYLLAGCNKPNEKHVSLENLVVKNDTVIVDCNYTFEEAVAGCNAPQQIIDELELIDVNYYSTDNKLHAGQIVVNRQIAHKLKLIFSYILKKRFPIHQVIPIVRYNWSDTLSMNANNSYCFCYRDVSYSKHARGLAIDINPFFNPVRWKGNYVYVRQNLPKGAHYNPLVPGTFSSSSEVVHQFKVHGFRWGHGFSRNFDDHHFELR